LARTENQVQVALTIGDDCGTTSVTAVISHAIHAKGGAVVASAAGGPPEVILTVRYSRAIDTHGFLHPAA
jgi:hypothetical protein